MSIVSVNNLEKRFGDNIILHTGEMNKIIAVL